MATYELKRTCLICGAMIGDENPDGLGSECREYFEKEAFKALFQDQDWSKKFHAPKIEFFLAWLIDYSSKHKFRSEFKKAFIPSVIAQLTEKAFLSKKQEEIIRGFLSWESEKIQRDFFEAENEIGQIQRKIVVEFFESLDAEKKQYIINAVLRNYTKTAKEA